MKWAVQSERRSASWTDTISEQRVMIDGVLEQSPSLRPQLVRELPAIIWKASALASRETKLPLATFQVEGEVNLERLLDPGLQPEMFSDLVG
jgi:hypothetical protein